MKRMVLWLLAFTFLFGAFAAAQEESAVDEAAGLEAAQAWLALVDQGDYGRSWEEAAGFFKAAVKQDQWVEQLTA
ncbi:MAG: DUF4019 domain-containing protein, partial [Thermodesulfobacteriota bacterium]